MPTALVRPYCTLESVQKETRNTKAANNDWFSQCINAASRFVEQHTNRDFWFHDHSASGFRVPRSQVVADEVFLKWPILTLTRVAVFPGNQAAPTSANDLPASAYSFEEGSSTITLEEDTLSQFWSLYGGQSGSILAPKSKVQFGPYPFKMNMLIEGTFGYAITDDLTPPLACPSAVSRATTILAANWSVEKMLEQVGLDGSKVELLDTKVGTEVLMLLSRWIYMLTANF